VKNNSQGRKLLNHARRGSSIGGRWKEALRRDEVIGILRINGKLHTFFLAMGHWQIGEKEEAANGATEPCSGWKKTGNTCEKKLNNERA